MTYTAKNYDHLMGGALKGFSDSQLNLHFTLYSLAKQREIEDFAATARHYASGHVDHTLQHRGAFLHELYFENLGADAIIAPGLQRALEAHGGRDKILADLKAAALSGPGWALLTHNRRDGRLRTYFLAEHTMGLPIEEDLLVVLDSWEHAFTVDFGIMRPDYIDAFLENLKWSEVSRRFLNLPALGGREASHEQWNH